jgi:hypothetical protein
MANTATNNGRVGKSRYGGGDGVSGEALALLGIRASNTAAKDREI